MREGLNHIRWKGLRGIKEKRRIVQLDLNRFERHEVMGRTCDSKINILASLLQNVFLPENNSVVR
jgi:hypothetical protein